MKAVGVRWVAHAARQIASLSSGLPRLPDRVVVRLARASRTIGSSSFSAGCRTGSTSVPWMCRSPKNELVPAGEREPGHRGGDADVDADHAGVEVVLELAGGPAAAGEDRGAVAIGAVAADGQGLRRGRRRGRPRAPGRRSPRGRPACRASTRSRTLGPIRKPSLLEAIDRPSRATSAPSARPMSR